MSTSILIPQLGWTMEEGTLQQWLVEDGSTVAEGQPIYTLETDKVENVIEAPVAGTIRQIGVAGEIYSVGHQVAEIE